MFEQIPDVKTYIIPLSTFLLSNALGIIISRMLFARLLLILSDIAGSYYEVITQSLKGVPVVLGALFGSYAAVNLISLDSYWLLLLEKVTVVVGVLTMTVMTARILSGVIKVYDGKANGIFPSASILANLAEVSIYSVGFLMILQNFGFSITPILTALGVGGLAVALALQDTLSNLFSGLHILLSKQIRVGDYIKLSTREEGTVADISWRNTTIKGLAGTVIIVSNQKIASANIINYYMPDRELSILIPASVSYDSNLDQVERVTVEVAIEVMRNVDGGIADFQPVVRFHTFADYSINFNVILRVKDFVNQYMVRHEFIKRLHIRYQQEGIEIPFPVRTIHIKRQSNTLL